MPSNPLPSSARSALREAAEAPWTADDTARLAGIVKGIANDAGLWHHGVFLQRAYDKLTDLLSLAERGAEDTKPNVEETAFQLWHRFATDEGSYVSRDAAQRRWDTLLNREYWKTHATAILVASSPTGGTTE